MPLALLSILANRNLDATTNDSLSSLATNATYTHQDALHVICAWPVSGQYGPGSRFLYYGLVAACVFARRIDWLRGACLAGALIIPAVSALHGITLAIMHVPGAVDLDIYGAFQACCIGILAAPITVKLSKTYFNDPGRNTIFLWTILILAGLLSLTVEFYRVTPSRCDLFDDQNRPILHPGTFPYRDGSMCNLTCSVDEKIPSSAMRTGAVNNVYVIPVPDKLTPGTATLMAAACCIPAILLLVSMWNTILEKNWQSRFGRRDEGLDDIIEGTNDATLRKMRLVNNRIGSFLALVEALVFGAAVFAVLIMGEINFWSQQVYWQTEPMQSYGQWGPLVGAALAALGSFYVLMISDREPAKSNPPSVHHCDCADHHHGPVQSLRDSGDSRDTQSLDHAEHVFESPVSFSTPFPNLEQTTSPSPMEQIRRGVTLPARTHTSYLHDAREKPASFSSDRGRSPGPSPTNDGNTPRKDAGGRLKIASKLAKWSEKLGTAERGLFDDSDFREGQATKWPSVPGEEFRNPVLQKTEVLYKQTLEETERRSRSRAPSFVGSVASGIDNDGDMRIRSVSPGPGHSASRPRRSQTMGHSPTSPVRSSTSPTSASSPGIPERRQTLEVPGGRVPIYHSARHDSFPTPGTLFIAVPKVEPQSPISPISPISPPAILVSEEPDSISNPDVPSGSLSAPRVDISPPKESQPELKIAHPHA